MSEVTARSLASGGALYVLRFAVSGASVIALNLYVMGVYPLESVGHLAVLLVVANVALLLSDFGMGSACVQRQVRDDGRLLSAMFTAAIVPWALVLAGGLLAWCLFPGELLLLVLGIAAAAPLNAARQLSIYAAERDLRFGAVASIEMVESVVLLAVTVATAMAGWGIWGFVVAHAVKCACGWLLTARLRAVPLRLARPDFGPELRGLLRQGIHFQTGSLLTAARQLANPAIVGSLAGMASVGLADRAAFIAGAPLLLLGAVQQKVLFPVFARLSDPDRRRRGFERSLYLSACADKLMYLPLALLIAPLAARFLPAGYEDLPGLVWLLLAGNVVFGALAFSCFPVLHGIGRSDVVARLHLGSAIGSWLLMWPLVLVLGTVGYALTSLALWAGLAYLVPYLRSHLPGVRIGAAIWPSLAAFAPALAAGWLVADRGGEALGSGVWAAACAAALAVYAATLLAIDGRRLTAELRSLLPGRRAEG